MVSELETAVRADLAAMIKEKNCHGIMVRVAWHDAGTFRPVLLSRSFCDDCTAYSASLKFGLQRGASRVAVNRFPVRAVGVIFLSPFGLSQGVVWRVPRPCR